MKKNLEGFNCSIIIQEIRKFYEFLINFKPKRKKIFFVPLTLRVEDNAIYENITNKNCWKNRDVKILNIKPRAKEVH